MTDNRRAYERAMTLAALSGFKIALGPAFLSSARGRAGARNWVLAALGEMVLDKVGVFPSRYRPSLLIPHSLAGGWVAHESLKEDGVDDPMGAVMGAAVAAAVAVAAPVVRNAASRLVGIPDPLLGVGEDYLALRLGSRAMGMSMGEVCDTARGYVGEARERVMPVLERVGVAS